MTSTFSDLPQTLHADREHNGIRLAIIIMLLVGVVLGFQLTSGLFRLLTPNSASDWRIIWSCFGALAFAIATIWVTEQVLKRLWPSGVKFVLGAESPTAVSLSRPEEISRQIDLGSGASAKGWFFKMSGYPRGGRERQINKNWLCVALELQQDETRLVSYTYAPRKRAEAWTAVFQEIFPADVYDTSFSERIGPPTRPEIPTEILRGKLGSYWLAEKRRWLHGAELSPKDFDTLLRFVHSHGLRVG